MKKMLSNVAAAVFSVFARGEGFGYFTHNETGILLRIRRGRPFPCLFFLKFWKPSGGAGYGYINANDEVVGSNPAPGSHAGVAQLVERENLRGRLFPRFTFLGGVGAGYFFGKYTRLRLFPGIFTFAMAQGSVTSDKGLHSLTRNPFRKDGYRRERWPAVSTRLPVSVCSSRLLLAVAQGADTSSYVGSNPIGCRVERPACPWPNGKALTGASRRLEKSHLRLRTFPSFFQNG
jgi:hypothetical protein